MVPVLTAEWRRTNNRENWTHISRLSRLCSAVNNWKPLEKMWWLWEHHDMLTLKVKCASCNHGDSNNLFGFDKWPEPFSCIIGCLQANTETLCYEDFPSITAFILMVCFLCFRGSHMYLTESSLPTPNRFRCTTHVPDRSSKVSSSDFSRNCVVYPMGLHLVCI